MSKIEWTGRTWNVVRGCVKISPGCKHCYSERFGERFRGVPGHPYEQGFDPRLVPNALVQPFSWTTPQLVFVCSMSDLFQDFVPEEYIRLVWSVMRRTPWHTYQVLTKRAERMRRLVRSFDLHVPPNIWLGVSVENRRYGIPRIEALRWTPAAIRFLSCEPLLESFVPRPFTDLPRFDLRHIHWVIVGGESGPGARLMKEEWVRGIRSACDKHAVPFFFKQWGDAYRKQHTIKESKGGRLLGGRVFDNMPSITRQELPSRHVRLELAEEIANAALLQGFDVGASQVKGPDTNPLAVIGG